MFSKNLHSVSIELDVLKSIAKDPSLSAEPELSDNIGVALSVAADYLNKSLSLVPKSHNEIECNLRAWRIDPNLIAFSTALILTSLLISYDEYELGCTNGSDLCTYEHSLGLNLVLTRMAVESGIVVTFNLIPGDPTLSGMLFPA